MEYNRGMSELNLDRIVRGVVKAGFAAYVEQTGNGMATLYASREWEEQVAEATVDGVTRRIVKRIPRTQADAVVGESWPRFDVAAGPGWFEDPNWTEARADTCEFCVGPDAEAYVGTDAFRRVTSERECVEAILTLLREPRIELTGGLALTPDEVELLLTVVGENSGASLGCTRPQLLRASIFHKVRRAFVHATGAPCPRCGTPSEDRGETRPGIKCWFCPKCVHEWWPGEPSAEEA
jgi:hypothetical protein